jgi:Ca2+/Na+ antiporter
MLAWHRWRAVHPRRKTFDNTSLADGGFALGSILSSLVIVVLMIVGIVVVTRRERHHHASSSGRRQG